jgi:asparagine synthase (glutamine-hydrolysing)
MPKWRIDWKILNQFQAQQKAVTVFKKHERSKLLLTNTSKSSFEESVVRNLKNPIHKINSFDIKYYLPGQLLSKIDKTSMMHSLEVRSPFLDTKLAEFVYNLPTEYKMSKTKNKIILKDILADIFPKDFVYRKKQGFGAPIKEWLDQENIKQKIDGLFNEKTIMYNYIDKDSVLKIRDDFYNSKKNSGNKLWLILCLSIWFKKHSQ